MKEALGSEEAYEQFQIMRRAALASMLRSLDRADYAALVEMYTSWSWDLTLLPSTPAWTYWNPMGGRLTVVGDRVVFFADRFWGPPKVAFVMRGRHVRAKHRASPWVGSVTLSLSEGDTKKKMVLTPPRNVRLREVSAPAEEPGWAEVVRELRKGVEGLVTRADGLEAAGDLMGTVGEAAHVFGEVFSMAKDYRIARIHQAIWREALERLARGESAPFGPAHRVTSLAAATGSRPKKANRPATPSRASKRVAERQRSVTVDDTAALAALVAARTNVRAEDAALVVDLLTETVATELQLTGRARVPRLGTFVTTTRSLSFRPTTEFREAVAREG
ncbi:MAG: hypothetical protein ACOYBU_05110 [Dermatophilaceae bacterium]